MSQARVIQHAIGKSGPDDTACIYATLKIPDICTAIFHENMQQPQATNCRTLNKQNCIVLNNTLARYIKKWVVGADFPLKKHTSFFFSHLEKVHKMFFSPFQLLCTFFHHEYMRTSLHRTYAED